MTMSSETQRQVLILERSKHTSFGGGILSKLSHDAGRVGCRSNLLNMRSIGQGVESVDNLN